MLVGRSFVRVPADTLRVKVQPVKVQPVKAQPVKVQPVKAQHLRECETCGGSDCEGYSL